MWTSIDIRASEQLVVLGEAYASAAALCGKMDIGAYRDGVTVCCPRSEALSFGRRGRGLELEFVMQFLKRPALVDDVHLTSNDRERNVSTLSDSYRAG